MSWNTEITATSKDAAKEELSACPDFVEGNMPATVRGLIAGAIDALPDCENSHIDITTYGHFHDSPDHRGGSNMRIIVQQRLDAVGEIA